MIMVAHETVEAYLADLPDPAARVIAAIRAEIRRVLPETGERISYGMPAATLAGRSLIHYAAWSRHVAVYPVPDDDELAPYLAGRGTLRFPLDRPVPYDLIGRVALRLADRPT